ncbi:restriction endonuclease subunit S [Psychrobacter celer]|uniref:restriction endonuclease subunit S n=1 Tax=Psychrobacter celer TaxID=306572 RepID=UPI003FD4B34C
MQSKIERYTPSDVGVVPADWATPLLSEVSTLITNGFVGTASPYYVDEHEGIPYFFGKNVRANKLEPIGIRYITPEFHEKQSKTALKTGDLLTVQSGHIGETAVVTEEYDNTNCHALIVTRLKQDLISPIFLSYYINSEIGKARLKGLEVGSTILHINTKDLKKFRIIQPSLPEQQKIAKILTTWDKAISTTERLIDNSKQLKKALMQQLLTGKKRLLDDNGKPFEGEWEEVQLSEIGKCIAGLTYSPSDVVEDSGLLVLRSSNIQNGVLSFEDNVYVRLDVKLKSKTKENDILICVRNGSKNLIGKSALIKGRAINQAHGAFMTIYRSKYPHYVFHLFQSDLYYRQVNRNLGATINSINTGDLNKFKFYIPNDSKEIEKIAAVLTNADKEIELLEQQLADLQQEKKALMQVLLTGKKRVIIDG